MKGLSISVHPPVCRSPSLGRATGGSLDYSVPLSVGRRRQNVARFHRRLRQILLVLGNSWANASVLPVEEARAAVLQVLGVVERRLWG